MCNGLAKKTEKEWSDKQEESSDVVMSQNPREKRVSKKDDQWYQRVQKG